MKAALRPLLALLLVITATLSAAEPLNFKGDALGMDLFAFKAKHDRTTRSESSRAPFIYFHADFRKMGAVRAEKAYPFEKAPSETIASVPATIQYWFYTQSIADWDAISAPSRGRMDQIQAETEAVMRDPKKAFTVITERPWASEEAAAAKRTKLGRITMVFPNSNFELVVLALTEKYGAPASVETAVFQTKAGAKFDGRVMKWQIGADTLEAVERHTLVDSAQVEFRSPAVVAMGSQILDKTIKQSAKDL